MNTKNIFKNKYYVMVFAIICNLLWASAYPTLKISYIELGIQNNDYMSNIMFAGMRFLMASSLIFIFIFINKIKYKIDIKFLINISILGLFQTSLQYFFFYNGLANTSGMKSAILATTGTFFVVLLAPFIYKDDNLNIKKIIGLILGFLGVIFVNWGKSFNFSFSIYGEGFLLLAGLASAIGTLMTKEMSKKYNTIVLTAYQMLVGSIFLLITASSHYISAPFHFTTKSTLLFVYSAFLSATAFSLWNTLLSYNKAGEISMFKFLIPVFGAFLSFVFLNEKNINVYTIISLIFVSFAILIINTNKKN